MALHPIRDLRFGARTAAFAAATLGTIGRFELEVRNMNAADIEVHVTSTVRRYGRQMCGLFGVKLDVVGAPEGYLRGHDDSGKGRVFVSNHRSALDIFVTLAIVEGRHVSRADLASWPLVGAAAKRAGVLFVNREDRRSAAAVIHEMIATIEHGLGIIVFAEGTTYSGDEVRPFKPGALAVARRTGCEVVPLGIAYAGAASSFGDESLLDHMRRVAGSGHTDVAVTIGEGFRADVPDTAELSRRAQSQVQDLVRRSRALLDAKA